MTAYVMPPRKWADDGTEIPPQPTVLVSSRDGAPVPGVRGAVQLVKALTAAGWQVGTAYALADVPYGWNRTRAPYQLASVGVRFSRDGQRGWACWYEVNGGGWRFSTGYLGMQKYGLRELTKALFEVKALVDELPYVPPLKSSHQCRRCARWLEGEWGQARDLPPAERDRVRAELQRQMDVGRCDDCTRREASAA